jgi:putative FmdB family regulatory protein
VPIYEFKCKECGSEFEELVFGSAEGVACPKCESSAVERLMSAFAFKSGEKFVPSGGASGCTSCHASSCASCKH